MPKLVQEVKVDKAGRLVIPIELRKLLNIGEGQILKARIKQGELWLSRK